MAKSSPSLQWVDGKATLVKSKHREKRVKSGKCEVHLCRGRLTTAARKKGNATCSKCLNRRWRANHTVKASYGGLRDHARLRHRKFTLTWEHFLEVVVASGYLERKGNRKDSLHIDRIDHRRGYEDGNIQVLTNSENAIKSQEEKRMTAVRRKIESWIPQDRDGDTMHQPCDGWDGEGDPF